MYVCAKNEPNQTTRCREAQMANAEQQKGCNVAMMHQVTGSSSDECKHAEHESQSLHSCVRRCTTVLGDANRCGRPSTGPADGSSDRHASRCLRSIPRTCYWEQMLFTCKTRISPPLGLGTRSQGKYLQARQSPWSRLTRLGWSEG